MARADRGTKRRCQSCGAPFYDLNRDPITCPKCETVFVADAPRVPVRAGSRASARAKAPVPVPEPEIEVEESAFEEDEVLETQDDEDEEFLPGGDQGEDGDEMRE